MEQYIDIEAALAEWIAGASAPPLPADFAENLPWVLFTRTGGAIDSRVLSTHNVSVDVYAATWAAAQQHAAEVASWITASEGFDLYYTQGESQIEVPVYSAHCQAPYNNPDPKHPNVPRVTFLATLATRTRNQRQL